MSIGSTSFFTKEHIVKHTFNANPMIAELAVHCLELVSELVASGLKFQFKGGNSLLLILDKPKRFSQDVDIATDASREEIENCVKRLVDQYGVFKRWEHRQHKTKPWLPLASFYLYFDSAFDNPDNFIMLDCQLRRSPYETEFKQIKCGDLYSCDQKVEIPFPSSIIGDKLLTLGPSTLGIPLNKNKEAQRLKHVFDVARLFELANRLSMIRESFNNCLKHELELQDREIDITKVVDDTLQFCSSTVAHASMPGPEIEIQPLVNENIKGLKHFSEHLFENGYNWDSLKSDLSKVALCIAAISNNSIADEQFSESINKINEYETSLNDIWTYVHQWTGKKYLEKH